MSNEPVTLPTLWLGFMIIGVYILNIFPQELIFNEPNHQVEFIVTDEYKQKAFKILETKCNSCHRRKNPFMVFTLKNMNKRAPKIHKQVFIKRRMPKGDQIKLTNEEYNILNKWLQAQNIY